MSFSISVEAPKQEIKPRGSFWFEFAASSPSSSSHSGKASPPAIATDLPATSGLQPFVVEVEPLSPGSEKVAEQKAQASPSLFRFSDKKAPTPADAKEEHSVPKVLRMNSSELEDEDDSAAVESNPIKISVIPEPETKKDEDDDDEQQPTLQSEKMFGFVKVAATPDPKVHQLRQTMLSIVEPPSMEFSSDLDETQRVAARTKLIGRLVESEREYVRVLQTLVDAYLDPLDASYEQLKLDKASVLSITSGIRSFVDFAVSFGKQMAQHPVTCFLDDQFGAAYEAYFQHADKSVSALQGRQLVGNPALRQFLSKALKGDKCLGVLALPLLLVLPLQRVRSYQPILLGLRTLSKPRLSSPKDEEEQELVEKASAAAQRVSSGSSAKDSVVDLAGLVHLEYMIDGCPPLYAPGRRVLNRVSCSVQYAKADALSPSKLCTSFLCSDLLILCTRAPKCQYRTSFILKGCEAQLSLSSTEVIISQDDRAIHMQLEDSHVASALCKQLKELIALAGQKNSADYDNSALALRRGSVPW